MSSDSDDLLSRLLTEAAASATPGAVREAAADSAHVDDATLAQMATGELDDEKSKAIRRHVLFCDECRDRSLSQSSAPASSKKAISSKVSSVPIPEKTRNRVGMTIGIIALTLALITGYLVVKATENEKDGREEDMIPEASIMSLQSLGSDGEGQRGVIRIDEPVVLDIRDDFGSREQFVYVLLFDANKKLSLLEPQSGSATAHRISGSMRLPVEPPGWDLSQAGDLKIGDELTFIILITVERIAALEGEIASRVTLPKMQSELATIQAAHARAGLSEVINKVRGFGFGALVRALSTVVRI